MTGRGKPLLRAATENLVNVALLEHALGGCLGVGLDGGVVLAELGHAVALGADEQRLLRAPLMSLLKQQLNLLS